MIKNHYYLVKVNNHQISRIKVVAIADNFIGYIHANARNNMEKMLIYIDVDKDPFEIIKDLGTNPDFSNDELNAEL
jgi:hypothetical protein